MRKFLQVRFHGGWIGLERPGIQGDHVAYPVDDKAVEVVPVEGDNRHLTELFLGRRQAQPSPDIDSGDDPSPEVERAQHFSRCERYRRNRIVRENRSEEHTSELQSRGHLVCRLLLEKKNSKTEFGI